MPRIESVLTNYKVYLISELINKSKLKNQNDKRISRYGYCCRRCTSIL